MRSWPEPRGSTLHLVVNRKHRRSLLEIMVAALATLRLLWSAPFIGMLSALVVCAAFTGD